MKPTNRLPQLGREVLSRVGQLRFAVAGDSMCPTLEPGDVAVIEPLRGQPPRAGEILLFAADDEQPVVHRLVTSRRHRGRLLLATKGDSARAWDPVVPETALLGRVTGVERGGQVFPVSRRTPTLLDRVRGWRYLMRHAYAEPDRAD